jgi:hypothetical protein
VIIIGKEECPMQIDQGCALSEALLTIQRLASGSGLPHRVSDGWELAKAGRSDF